MAPANCDQDGGGNSIAEQLRPSTPQQADQEVDRRLRSH
jgi:hypothetical protein